ncbi:subtilisin-like serine protease 2 [Actinidia rufa]|uniref:Subtilisin-like serine protease 2 n=1 Tax=Actinidia rufa TaxID=165716 RepID=A0A7J0ETY4_9ERIC|nr:subtilisin-like serine protease 2 [Actinidia rufa]
MGFLLHKSLLSLLFFHFLITTLANSSDQTVKTYIFRIDRFAKPSIFPTHYHWTIQVITRSPVNCPIKKPSPDHLNYPSIAALFSSSIGGGSKSKTFVRTATNVGPINSVYRVRVESPKGTVVTVKPSTLVFSDRVKKIRYAVTITVDPKNLVLDDSGAVFGSLSWVDGKHVVRSPIVVTQIDPL